MRTEAESDLLQAIFNEMQELKHALAHQNDSRVSVKDFADRMAYSERTLWGRVKDGEIEQPLKDGRFSYWLNSYVNEVVTRHSKTDKVAAY